AVTAFLAYVLDKSCNDMLTSCDTSYQSFNPFLVGRQAHNQAIVLRMPAKLVIHIVSHIKTKINFFQKAVFPLQAKARRFQNEDKC
ncbi:hypothetical protein C6496_03500, partial [Candidatus Poribacteria bacterium]